MALFTTAIAAARYVGAMPKPLVYMPSVDYAIFGVTEPMQNDDERTEAEPQTNPYAFLDKIENLDCTIGIMTQVQLAEKLNLVESTVRAAGKAIAAVIPVERLKEGGKGKLTAQGIAFIEAYLDRGDATAEAWIHGLMEVMKSPQYKSIKGETATADDFDLSFLDNRLKNTQAQTSALALTANSELAALLRKSTELDQKSDELSDLEKQQAFQSSYQRELEILTEKLKGKIAAQEAFNAAMRQGPAPEI